MYKLNDVRIFVEKDSGWIVEPRKGTVELLDTDYSILHTAGRKSMTRNISFVVFSGYYTNIVPLVDDSSVTFEDDAGTDWTVTIMKESPERLYNFRDYYDGTEVFRVSMDLMRIES